MAVDGSGRPPAAGRDDGSAVIADQRLLEACIAFLAAERMPTNGFDDPAADEADVALDPYYASLREVTATRARTAFGLRAKATVAIRAMQSVAHDLHPEERVGLATLIEFSSFDRSVAPAEMFPLPDMEKQLKEFASLLEAFHQLAQGAGDSAASPLWKFLENRFRACHAAMTMLCEMARIMESADRRVGVSTESRPGSRSSAETGVLDDGVALLAALVRMPALRRLVRNTALTALQICATADGGEAPTSTFR